MTVAAMYGIDDLKNSQKLEVMPRSSAKDDDDVDGQKDNEGER